MSKKFEVQALDRPKRDSPVNFAAIAMLLLSPLTIWTVISGIKKLITMPNIAEVPEEQQKSDNLPKVIYYTRSVPIRDNHHYCECAGGEKTLDWGGFAPSAVRKLLKYAGVANQVQFWEFQKLSTSDADAAVVILDYDCKVDPSYARMLEHCRQHHPNAKVVALFSHSNSLWVTPRMKQSTELLMNGSSDLGDTVTIFDPGTKGSLIDFTKHMRVLVLEAIDPEYAANMHERRTTTDARRQLA